MNTYERFALAETLLDRALLAADDPPCLSTSAALLHNVQMAAAAATTLAQLEAIKTEHERRQHLGFAPKNRPSEVGP